MLRAPACDQSAISQIEGGTRLTEVVELENVAVLYQKPLNFFNLEGPA
jgi:hypothetical protein